jgi:tRNA-uridine 2-sulfurtransferase
MSSERILVAMSGGVDSSVAAALLAERGAEVIGVSMHLHTEGGEREQGNNCCSPDDFEDARSVAHEMGFPYYVLNLRDQFKREVIDRFVGEYLAGRTPNPCILCNDALKFEALRKKAVELECVAVATGHYAQIERIDGRYGLFRGIDNDRDQSYFLFTLTQMQMAQVRFPVGGLTKSQVRSEAVRLGLRVAEKSESREICFIPDDDYAGYVSRSSLNRETAGRIVDKDGNALGEHSGYHQYTIGQRRGLGIAYSEPLYVLAIRPDVNEVVVGVQDELLSNGLIASKMNWLDGEPPEKGTAAFVKIRYMHSGVDAELNPLPNQECEVRFAKPIRAVAPGQAVVAYLGDRVLGGGWIERAVV